MTRRFLVFLTLTSAVALGVVVACGSGPDAATDNPIVPGPDVGTNTKDAGTQDSRTNDAALPEGGPATGRVYAQTADTLYLFEPLSRKLTWIGQFDCVDEPVLDIAVNRTGSMYGTTNTHFVSIDPVTAKCHVIASSDAGAYPNSLSFVPQGTVDQTKEVLVGYAFEDLLATGSPVADDYVTIDTATGSITHIDFLDPINNQWQSSGDLVSLINAQNKTYLTIRPQNQEAGAPQTDYLAEVDPATGQLKNVIGPTNQLDIFGLGYWAGKAYGFSEDGRITEINASDGGSTVIFTLKDDAGTEIPWFGAGVTTLAPVTP